jgi:hypothetical protein
MHDAYRPNGLSCPITPDKRFLRLPVALVLPGGSAGAPAPFGSPFRQAWADWAYLQTGDYLAGPEGILFVASIEPPKPILVVMTNTRINLSRPAAPFSPGINPYSAIRKSSAIAIAEGFPASILAGGIDDRTRIGLPDDTKLPGFTALFPACGDVTPRVADMISTHNNENYIVTGADQVLGTWRLSLNQVVT